MKKLLILLLLSSNALAADSCQYIWNLTGKGLNLGKSYDSLSLDSKMEINSIFEPSKFVATFGVKKVFRVVNFEDNKIVSRKEETFGKNNEDIIWNSKNNINWEKFEDSHKVDEIIIDSKNKL